MKLRLHTEGWFDAAHNLENYPGDCKNLHGHTYKVEVWIEGNDSQLDDAGILWDFGKLKELTSKLDHSVLGNINIILGCNATAENLCKWFYDKIKKYHPELGFKVRVYEQLEPKKSYCECGDF